MIYDLGENMEIEKKIESINELLDDVGKDTRVFLEFAINYPDRLIPVFPNNQTAPEEAEKEARNMVKELRDIEVDKQKAVPVFQCCHVERERIWCEFSLNPAFVEILRR